MNHKKLMQKQKELREAIEFYFSIPPDPDLDDIKKQAYLTWQKARKALKLPDKNPFDENGIRPSN